MTALIYSRVAPPAVRLAVLTTTIGLLYAFADLLAPVMAAGARRLRSLNQEPSMSTRHVIAMFVALFILTWT